MASWSAHDWAACGFDVKPKLLRFGGNQFSDPALYRLAYIGRQLIKAHFGLGCVFMNHVDQLLKQYEVVWDYSYARADHDTIPRLVLELALNNCLSGFAEIG